MIVAGLTGNYGMGKSTVARMFGDLGARMIDADKIVRGLLAEPAVIEEIRQAFGEDAVVNGAVDKKWLADKVFQDASARVALENIIHPMVFQKVDEELSRLSSEGDCIVIVEATVIFERGHQGKFDKIITVFTPEETALQRLTGKGLTEEEVKRRLGSQLPIETKKRGSDFVIDNSKDIENTREQVRTIYQELLAAEKKRGNN